MAERVGASIAQPASPHAPPRQHRDPGRDCCPHRRARRRRDLRRGAKSRARPHRLGLRLLEQHRRFRYQPDADRLFGERVDLRPRVLGRSSQYAPRCCNRHRARDRARLHRRHCAAVEQLAGRRACRRLRRTDPQRAAPAATFVLVQRRAQIAAGIARQRDVAGRRASSTIAACSCRGRNLGRISRR